MRALHRTSLLACTLVSACLAGCATTGPREPAAIHLSSGGASDAAIEPSVGFDPSSSPADVDVACIDAAPRVSRAAPKDEWTYQLSPYLWMTAIDGNATVKGHKTGVNVNFSDIVDNLDFAGLLSFEAMHNDWSFIADLIYLSIEAEGGNGSTNLDVGQKTTIINLAVAHPFVAPDSLEWLAGVRYWNLEANLDVSGGPDFNGSKHWVDPIVGLRQRWAFDEDWGAVAWGDIGGFGVGSDSTWEAALLSTYRVGESGSLYAGYRAISVDYDDGSGADRFEFNTTIKGPVIGGGFRF